MRIVIAGLEQEDGRIAARELDQGQQAGREPLLCLRGVGKVYPTGSGDFSALRDISFDLYPGEFLGILGKSGAGKTTLLNLITGVSALTAGEIRYCRAGAEPLRISVLGQDALAAWRGRNLGIVHQSFELLPQLDLVNNIMLPQAFAGGFRPGISQARALALLELVELREHAFKLPAQISGGQKQRVAIARALVNDPLLIAADEPTGSLDSVTSETILRIFERLVRQGTAVLMVTHEMALRERFSRCLTISDGALVEEDGREQTPFPVPAQEPQQTNRRAGGHRAAAHGPAPAILLQGVAKTYSSAAGRFDALKGVDLAVWPGEFVALVGKSGSGKSTLLNMLTGIDYPTAGTVRIGGEDIYALSESARALWRGRTVGIVFQFFQLLPTLSLLENVILPMDYCDVFAYSERRRRAGMLLAQVGLAGHEHDLPAHVSAGQQQAAAIARALATDPPILVADEPTGNLDSRAAAAVIDLLRELAAQGKTVLIVTHDPTMTALADRTLILSDGLFVDPPLHGPGVGAPVADVALQETGA